MKRRIYTDTSVIGGCFDAEFKQACPAAHECVRTGETIMVLPDLTATSRDALFGSQAAVERLDLLLHPERTRSRPWRPGDSLPKH